MAEWIKKQYRPFVKMCRGLYETPAKSIESYTLNEELTTSRLAVYSDGDLNILVLRGTSLHKTDKSSDIGDDIIIATNYGQTSLEKEGNAVLNKLTGKVILTGHSLGGYAALKLAKSNDLECCVFNPGTSPKNPITTGPGSKGIAYHIVGDMISAYIKDEACEVVRVDLGLSPLDTLYAHSLDRFEGGDEVKGYLTAQEENDIYKGVDSLIQAGLDVIGTVSPQVQDVLYNLIPSLSSNIPGTTEENDGMEIAILEMVGLGALAPGLMAFRKAKTPGQKAKAIISSLKDPKVQAQLKAKADQFSKFYKERKIPSRQEVMKMMKSKFFKAPVKIPKNLEKKKGELNKLFAKVKVEMPSIKEQHLARAASNRSTKPPTYFQAIAKDTLPKYEQPPEYVKQKSAIKRPGAPLEKSKKRVLIQSKKDYNPFEEDKGKKVYKKETFVKNTKISVKPPVIQKAPVIQKPTVPTPIKKPVITPAVKPPLVTKEPLKRPLFTKPVIPAIKPALPTKIPVKPISLISNKPLIGEKVPSYKRIPEIKKPSAKFKFRFRK